MWAIIGTWAMVYEGIKEASNKLVSGASSREAIEIAITDVEDTPGFKSVGYGGLPNKEMVVELDAGFMDGDTFDIGAIMGVHDIANPIRAAMALAKENYNNILAGPGAEKYAADHGFEFKDMLTDKAKYKYYERLKEDDSAKKLSAYDGSDYDSADTVCVAALDLNKNISVGTSTSGLFMKHPGRVGDSPIVGSGFYADSEVGAAAATGMGEDLMRHVISYEVVRLMADGLSAMDACREAIDKIDKKLRSKREISDMSIIAIDKDGVMGAATNTSEFSFVYAGECDDPQVYLAKNIEGDHIIEKATKEWYQVYMEKRR